MGHEAIGIVEDVGADVRTIKRGDLVVMPFAFSDGTCAFCHEGLHTACVHGGFFDDFEGNAAQAEALRVPYADGTLFALPVGEDDALMPSLLTLSDVMGTGHHAAVVAEAGPGKIAAVVGDGAVGLCGVIAAKRLGAEQIIILGRHADRIALAREFGATDVVSERGDEAVERVRELTGGFGAHSVLECVGHGEAVEHGDRHRPPRRRGRPRRRAAGRDDARVASRRSSATSRVGGGPAPARAYIEELLPDILEGRIEPGRVFDRTVDLDEVPDGYRAMADRESIKVMVTAVNPVYDFDGQVALVTGASSGMGLATARAFAAAGAAVVLADIDEDALRAATDELTAAGHTALGVELRRLRRDPGRRPRRPRGRRLRPARHGLQQRRHPGPADRRRRRAGRARSTASTRSTCAASGRA